MLPRPKARPNILLITMDQLRYDYVGAYQPAEQRFMDTPCMDALARDGCLYTHAYSPNPVCIPARYNMITGLTARHHGFDDNYFGPEAKPAPWNLPTFAQILSDVGYSTAAVGKMHFQPERRATGFDFFLNADEVVDDVLEDDYAMDLRSKGYGSLGSYHGVRNALYMQPQQSLLPEELHGSHWIADRSIDFLRLRGNTSRPFLLWTGFKHPHPPFDIPEAWAHKYDGKIPPHTSSATPLSLFAEENKCIADLPDEENINRMRELYACAVSFVDYNIGRIVQALKDYGYYDNTLIIVTADHGEMLGDLDTYQKFLPHDPSCRIPLILHWPQGIQPGTVEHGFADLNDILPTMADLAGTAYPADYDLPGESLFASDPKKDRRWQYVEHQRESKRWCMIRNERYKYVHFYGDHDQLFDMLSDPQERVNLLHGQPDPSILAVREELRAVLLRYEERYGLPGYVESGAFTPFPPYQIQTYRETCSPCQTVRIRGEEDSLTPLEEEIVAAIRREPTVHLSKLNIEALLKNHSGLTDERYRRLCEMAKEIDRY